MRKLVVSLFTATCLLLPSTAFMATVGFVPSTGVWFSTSTFDANQSIKVYTVVVNNDYASLDGVVGFYDNDKLIGSANFKSLTKESAQQISINWVPSQGDHTVQARFMSATTVDTQGKKSDITLTGINNVSGMPLTVGSAAISPVAQVNDTAKVVGAVAVNIVQEGKKLLMSPQVASVVSGVVTNEQTVAADDLFAKNHDLLNKAQGVATSITTTAGKITDAYNQTKSVIEQGQMYYEVGKEKLVAAQPYFEKAKEWWLVLTENNDPKRVALVACVLLFLWILTKLFRRRQRRREYDDFE